jgi:hypothetical protein
MKLERYPIIDIDGPHFIYLSCTDPRPRFLSFLEYGKLRSTIAMS